VRVDRLQTDAAPSALDVPLDGIRVCINKVLLFSRIRTLLLGPVLSPVLYFRHELRAVSPLTSTLFLPFLVASYFILLSISAS